MKKIIIATLALIIIASSAWCQIGSWKAYMAYQNITEIQSTGNELFVLASNNLYQYNQTDQSITTYDKVSGLSDTYITHIAWCKQAKKLVVVYQNSNIDLVETNGNVTNISDLYNKIMTSNKQVNSITIDGVYAYLACGFGIVKLNVSKNEITESYIFDFNIHRAVIDNGRIYASSGNGVLTASLTDNLIDTNNWQTTTSYPSHLYQQDTTDYDTYLPIVSTLSPGGPKYNYFNFMKVVNGKLYTVGGGWRDGGQFFRKGTAQILNANGEWTILQDDMTPYSGQNYIDATSIAVDPNDENHIFVSTCGTGLYEFRDGKSVYNYTEGNSEFISVITNNPDYVRVDGLVYDTKGNLWMTNGTRANKVIKMSASKEFTGYHNNRIMSEDINLNILRNSILDSKGNIWLVNDHHNLPCAIKLNTNTENFTRYDNFRNQNGTAITIHYCHVVAEDKEGNIWLGTDAGPFMYTQEQIDDPTQGFTQVIVPRNDGTDYADYLLSNIEITCMAIDGANRKWFGTGNNGVYVISSDNMAQLYHFTTDNSKLISNEIESIAINDATGEVFIGTSLGLCSYMSDATSSNDKMSKNNVYAYPNPVRPDYDGLITVTGLSYNADVKIVTASGVLVAEGRSNGGTFTWDGRDKKGKRVASGVYNVVTATSEGKKGTVCKVAIVR